MVSKVILLQADDFLSMFLEAVDVIEPILFIVLLLVLGVKVGVDWLS